MDRVERQNEHRIVLIPESPVRQAENREIPWQRPAVAICLIIAAMGSLVPIWFFVDKNKCEVGASELIGAIVLSWSLGTDKMPLSSRRVIQIATGVGFSIAMANLACYCSGRASAVFGVMGLVGGITLASIRPKWLYPKETSCCPLSDCF
jgi:membrane associated rhomboid family serine protease